VVPELLRDDNYRTASTEGMGGCGGFMNLVKIKGWFKSGLKRVKWFVALISERLHVEFALIKILSDIEELKRKKGELAKGIGERVIELRDTSDYDLFSDAEIKRLLKEIETLEEEMNALKSKAGELSKVED